MTLIHGIVEVPDGWPGPRDSHSRVSAQTGPKGRNPLVLGPVEK